MNSLSLITHINNLFNEFDYVPDSVLFNEKDHWQTPKEFIKNGAGDCEDYAVSKYFMLKQFNIESWLLYCSIIGVGYHICDLVNLGGNLLVLDNRKRIILPVSERDDIIPAFRFDTEEVKVLDREYNSTFDRDITMLRQWVDLLERMKVEESDL